MVRLRNNPKGRIAKITFGGCVSMPIRNKWANLFSSGVEIRPCGNSFEIVVDAPKPEDA